MSYNVVGVTRYTVVLHSPPERSRDRSEDLFLKQKIGRFIFTSSSVPRTKTWPSRHNASYSGDRALTHRTMSMKGPVPKPVLTKPVPNMKLPGLQTSQLMKSPRNSVPSEVAKPGGGDGNLRRSTYSPRALQKKTVPDTHFRLSERRQRSSSDLDSPSTITAGARGSGSTSASSRSPHTRAMKEMRGHLAKDSFKDCTDRKNILRGGGVTGTGVGANANDGAKRGKLSTLPPRPLPRVRQTVTYAAENDGMMVRDKAVAAAASASTTGKSLTTRGPGRAAAAADAAAAAATSASASAKSRVVVTVPRKERVYTYKYYPGNNGRVILNVFRKRPWWKTGEPRLVPSSAPS